MKALKKNLFLLLILIGCHNTQIDRENKILTFNLDEITETSDVNLSELGFVDVEYIPLETNEKSIISRTDGLTLNWGNFRIIACNNRFLIKIWNSLIMFRSDGSFICTIGNQGRGPEEYQTAHDVDINEEDNCIYVVSGWQKKINVYSEDGEFMRTFKEPLYAPIGFKFTDGNILIYCENYTGTIENSYALIDINGGIIKYFPNKYPYLEPGDYAHGFTHENLFYKFNNQLFIKELYSDTIYVFEKLDFKPHLVIAAGDRLITTNARSEYDGLYLAKNYINPLNLFEFGDFVFYGFIYEFILSGNIKLYGFICSKQNDFQVLIDLNQGIVNDLDGGPNIIPITILDDKTVIALIDPLKLKTHIISEVFKNSTPKYPEKKKELEKLAASLKETDNPILVLVRLKN